MRFTRLLFSGLLIILLFFLSELYGQFSEWQVFNYKFEKSTNKDFYMSVECCDIDMDGDFDLFVGNWDGFLRFYRNTGRPDKFQFKLEKKGTSKISSYNKVFIGNRAVPSQGGSA